MHFSHKIFTSSICIMLAGLTTFSVSADIPADKIDLKHWKITLPMDDNSDGKVDEVDVGSIKKYSHPDYFYVDENGFVVFTAPNRAATTSGSSNTRSELRQMYRGVNKKIGTKDPKNNFVIRNHRRPKKYADVGGQLESTLRVMHVATNAKHPDKPPAFSVVVGQIHALKNDSDIKKGKGFGHGNEPLKIYYKKWPGHKTGSVFWTYERNLEKANPKRTDIAYPVWGNTWENSEDPGDNGIALGQLFNYNVNVHDNIMYLTFRTTDATQTVTQQIDLSNNVDANGNVDEHDNPKGYTGDMFYFKAGAYNQCSTQDTAGSWYPACSGTGDWETDKANGDYTSVAFKSIKLARSVSPAPKAK